MRFASAAILTLVLATAIIGQEHKEKEAPPARSSQTPTQPTPQPSPVRYTSPEGRYTVLFPQEPKLSTQQTTAGDGSPLTQYMAMAAGKAEVMFVAYFDYSGNLMFSLDKARDALIAGIKGTLVDEHSMSLGGAPGRQIRVAAKTTEGVEYINRARFYDLKPRVYILQCMTTNMLDTPATTEKCEQFFDSFRVRTLP